MADSKDLARRLRAAMDNHEPSPVTSAAVARKCGVTPQAVNGWRKNGRIAKRHLLTVARMCGKPTRYFLGDDSDAADEAEAFRLAEDWLALPSRYREHVRKAADDALNAIQKYPELHDVPLSGKPLQPQGPRPPKRAG